MRGGEARLIGKFHFQKNIFHSDKRKVFIMVMNFFIQKLIYDLTQGVDGSLLRNSLGFSQWTSLLGITFIEKKYRIAQT